MQHRRSEEASCGPEEAINQAIKYFYYATRMCIIGDITHIEKEAY
jgi:hypothetical protein